MIQEYAPKILGIPDAFFHPSQKEDKGAPEGIRQEKSRVKSPGAHPSHKGSRCQGIDLPPFVKTREMKENIHDFLPSRKGDMRLWKDLAHGVKKRRCHHRVADPVRQTDDDLFILFLFFVVHKD
jgi:hypothetical protein